MAGQLSARKVRIQQQQIANQQRQQAHKLGTSRLLGDQRLWDDCPSDTTYMTHQLNILANIMRIATFKLAQFQLITRRTVKLSKKWWW